MRRSVGLMIGGVLVVGLLGLAVALPVAARGMWGLGLGPSRTVATPGATVTMAQARDRATRYLSQVGLGNLEAGPVMQFSNQFYVAVVDPATGSGALELRVSLDGQVVWPEPTMTWNTQYNPMFGSAGPAPRGYGMMGEYGSGSGADGYGYGMMGGSGAYGNAGDGDGMMGGVWGNGYQPGAGSPLATPLTSDTALTRAQAWLAQNQPGVTAADPTAFPGYFTFHTLAGGKITGLISVQASTGAVWQHGWAGGFVAMDAGTN
ncbi:MAG TPA: hypothetical protein VFN57_18895 [Thermomicrobiaceae bacterium]|nr:hypothetical protein [Thermomicrobiaceae bacterium]